MKYSLKNNRNVQQIVKWITPKKAILVLLGLLFIISQGYLFINKGTILGYQLRNVEQDANKTSSTASESAACKAVPASKVSDVLKLEVKRLGGEFGDITQPNFMSSCVYRTNQTPSRSVTIIIRESKNQATAEKTFQSAKEKTETEEIKGLGEGAFYSAKSNQLQARQGKRLLTITVSKPINGSEIDSKTAAIKLSDGVL